LHWRSFNEAPKENISRRAVINDFKGDFVAPTLHDRKNLLERVNTPLTASRDEWAEAFMDLAKLVVEGFETKGIRAQLDTDQISYSLDDKTIALLEKLLNKGQSGESRNLTGLRTVQNLRSKAKGHAGGSEADELAQNALMEHESFTNHFNLDSP
jgi:hypothetical protein